MMNRTRTGVVLLVLAQGLAGCGSGSSSAPSAPSSVSQPTPIQLAVFTDPASGFSISDVRDAQEQIVRFTTSGELIWTPTATRFPGFPVYRLNIQAHNVCPDCSFFVRFGTKDGEQRGYLTLSHPHDGYYRVNILDIEVVDGQLVVTETNVLVPGS